MHKKLALALIAAALCLTVTACGGSTPASESAASTPAPVEETSGAPMEEEPTITAKTAGEYAYATEMTFGKFEIPGDPDKGFVDIMKRYDKTVDPKFVNVKVDNREGYESAGVVEVRIYDKAGEEYKFVSPLDLLDAMRDEDESKIDYDTEYMKYWDKYNTSVSMGQLATETLISLDDLPDEFARVIVNTGIGGDIEAVTLDEAVEQGYPLDF